MAGRRKVRILRLSWPVEARTVAALIGGDAAVLDTDPWFARLLAQLRASNPLGDFGAYQAVAEIVPCWELFTPAQGAQPTRGERDAEQVSANLMVTLHVPAETPADLFESLLDALVAEHPWEVPVIEVSEAELLVRNG